MRISNFKYYVTGGIETRSIKYLEYQGGQNDDSKWY